MFFHLKYPTKDFYSTSALIISCFNHQFLIYFHCCGRKELWDETPSFTETSLIIEKSLINESFSLCS